MSDTNKGESRPNANPPFTVLVPKDDFDFHAITYDLAQRDRMMTGRTNHVAVN